MSNHYHNTNQLQGDNLKQADSKAKHQEKNALAIYKRLWNQWLTRFAFQREYNRVHEVWLKDGVASRILRNLEANNGPLEKSTDAIYPGEFKNIKVYAWKLRVVGDLFGSTFENNQDAYGGMQ